MHGHGGMAVAPHCTPSSWHLCHKELRCCISQTGHCLLQAGRQATACGKMVKKPGAMYCAGGGRMYCCANDTQQRRQIMY